MKGLEICHDSLSDMIKQLDTRSEHDGLGDGVDLAVHQELLLIRELHEDDSEVGSSEIQRQELALLLAIGQLPDEGGEALDRGVEVTLLGEALLDRVTHLLLQDVDVVIVQHQVTDEILNEPTGTDFI